MANIKTGWIMFTEGMGPMSVWDKGSEMAVKPEGKYKRGFHVMVYGGDSLPGIGKLGLREFSSTAGVANTALVEMYRIYEEQVRDHPAQVPLYQCAGVKPISGMYGTNYEPLFQIGSWIDRAKLPDFDKHLAAPPGNGPMPPMTAHGNAPPPTRPVHPAPDPNAAISDFSRPSGEPPNDDIRDEIPW